MLEVNNPQSNHPKYFDPLFHQLKTGGVEAFLHEMLDRRITRELGQPPATDALGEQKQLSMTPVERWAIDIATSGMHLRKVGS